MDAEVFVGRACELLAIPSTSERPADLRRALDYVLDFVGPGFTVERFESGGKPSALIYPGTERRDFHVILNAHLDVVPAPPDQFRPRRDGDRLFARGAQDMKVTGLLAAQVFRELAASLPYPVALQLVTDEEVGGRDGTRHQLDHGVRGRFVIVGETSGLHIVNESKGMLVVRLLATGRAAHAAYQWLGDNALVKLQRTVASLKNAYENKAPLTFSTDADYYVVGKTRGEVCLEFLKTWKDAGIPNADILRAMTINGYRVSETEKTRGPIKTGFFADMIAVPGNPLDDVDALKNVQFVMKDGQVFKKDGVMTPAAFFHGGPVNGWRIR